MKNMLATLAIILAKEDVILTGFSQTSFDCVILRRGRTNEEIVNCMRNIKVECVLLLSQYIPIDDNFKIRYKIVNLETYNKVVENLKNNLKL